MVKKILTVWIGANIIELVIATITAPYFGFKEYAPVWGLIIVTNLGVAFWAHHVYKKK